MRLIQETWVTLIICKFLLINLTNCFGINCPSDEEIKPCSCEKIARVIFCEKSGSRIDNLSTILSPINTKYSSTDETFTLSAKRSKINKLTKYSLLKIKFAHIGIADADLNSIDVDAFRFTRDTLRLLDLERNKLTNDVFQSFLGLNNIEWISLRSNQISTIPNNLFHSEDGSFPVNLKGIILSDNWIHDITECPFYYFSRLQLIDLSSNWLTRIDGSTLVFKDDADHANLSPLAIDLSNNQLNQNSFFNFNWSNSKKPINLFLTHNHFTFFNWTFFCPFFQRSPHNHLTLDFNLIPCEQFNKLKRSLPWSRLQVAPCLVPEADGDRYSATNCYS